MVHGELYVVTSGEMKMHALCVANWTFLNMVHKTGSLNLTLTYEEYMHIQVLLLVEECLQRQYGHFISLMLTVLEVKLHYWGVHITILLALTFAVPQMMLLSDVKVNNGFISAFIK